MNDGDRSMPRGVGDMEQTMLTDREVPAGEIYRRRIATVDQRLDEDQRRDHRYGTARVTAFVAVAVSGFIAATGGGMPFGMAALIAAVVFLGLVIANEPIRRRMETDRAARKTLTRLLGRVEGDWSALQRLGDPIDPVSDLSPLRRAVASDLDLFGTVSLFRLISVCGTTNGVGTLAAWLTDPIDAKQAILRSETSAVMMSRREDRLAFYETAHDVGQGGGDPKALTNWAAQEGWLGQRKWLLGWAAASIALTVTSVIAAILGWAFEHSLATTIGSVGLLVIPTINLLLSMTYLSPMHQIFSVAIRNRHSVASYQSLVELAKRLIDSDSIDNPLADRLSARLRHPEHGAETGFASLQRVATAGSLRSSAATFLLYLPLQLYGLYDLWILRRLEDWQARHRDNIVGWFDAIGEIEALASLSAVRDEYPDWTTPRWVDADASDVTLTSTGLGHPLLPADQRVCNDVSIGPRGTLLLVTGSNMSGKSTMLRSVGLNVALAGAGGPVCATAMSLPPVEMATSIRVSDDLSRGVSFYMAELKRLKTVVDRAKELGSRSDQTCLFLLDEILQGTNSRERQIAVARVLDSLVDAGAIGAITTHDLELADDKQLMSRSRTVHFRETITRHDDGRDEMSFDYQMHQGVCPTTNAIRLLEIVGL